MTNALRYIKHEPLTLKGRADFNEAWLQQRIVEDPTILGLGDVEVTARERRQETGGRLDLLLSNPEENIRYEVELMLGPTDESHIIRCIEYWDEERRRYPAYDHRAVLVAENITSRFINVLSLFAGNVPLIAIQLSALKVQDQIVLNFVRVLNQVALREDDTADENVLGVDRDYWTRKTEPRILLMVESCLDIINQKANPKQRLSYKRSYIGLTDGSKNRNFAVFWAKKAFMYLGADIRNPEEWKKRFEDVSLEAGVNPGNVWVRLTPDDLKPHQDLIAQLLHQATQEHQAR